MPSKIRNPKRSRAALRYALALISVSLLLPGSLAAAQTGGNAPALELSGPAQVEVGEPFVLTLRAKGAANLGGFETAVLFDVNAAEFAGLDLRSSGLKDAARDVSPVSVVELPSGAAFGAYTCPVADCAARPGSVGFDKQLRGADGDVMLGTFTLIANEPGELEIRLDAVKLVDAGGNPVAVSGPNPSITVQVGGRGEGPAHPAPAGLWQLAPKTAERPVAPEGLDLNFDGLVSHADAMEVAIEWELARLDGDPCGATFDPSRDLNGDGCIDVSDMQLAAAAYSPDAGGAPPAAPRQTFVVNTTGDGPDADIGNGVCQTASGFCTLRAAIQEANALNGPDTIHFSIPGSGLKTIALSGKLPTLNDSSGPTTIDGYTQPGASPNTNALTSNAVIRIEVKGKGEDRFDGLTITSAGNVIRGLAFYQLRRALWIKGIGADNNLVTGAFIGTNAAGAYGAPAAQPIAHGIHIESGASGNQIGGPAPAERNVISGNARHGVGIWHNNSDGNVIVNNLVGLSPNGTARIPNRVQGIDLNFGTSSNLVEDNVSSGNDGSGIEISHTADTTDNLVIGNHVGTNAAGTQIFAYTSNKGRGIMIEDGAAGNTITENVIGGNVLGGIEIRDTYTMGNHIFDNRIGIGLNGSAIGNPRFGVLANGSENVIGPDNVIAYNENAGIKIEKSGADRNTITQNAIFSNGAWGIELFPQGVTQNDAGDGDSGPNENLNFPVITGATTQQVSGTACANCTVEIFIADSAAGTYGEGKTFAGSGTADASGDFTINVNGVSASDVVTATATDGAGNTSEFSKNVAVD